LADHKGTSADHKGTLAAHKGTLAAHEGTLAAHEGTLADHKGTLADHKGTLADHKGTPDCPTNLNSQAPVHRSQRSKAIDHSPRPSPSALTILLVRRASCYRQFRVTRT
jgi:hypothetical protein